MNALEAVLILLIIVGLFFNFLGSLGLLRFPDVYTRLHTATKATTFGSIFITIAVVIYAFAMWHHDGWYNGGDSSYLVMMVHSIVALLALIITNPTGAHAIARAAYRSGVKPELAVVDQREGVDVE